jgi:hypothetical protein
MPVAVRIDVNNPFPSQLLRWHQKMSDWRPELKKGRENYRDHVEAVFLTEGAATGLPWQGLSLMRQRIREGQRVGWAEHPILRWDDDLIDVATMRKSSGNKVSGSYRTGRTELLMSISGEKVTNQFGQSTGKYHLPAREFWPFSQTEVELFFKPFVDWATSQVSAGVIP